jgi:hypothetical protein
MFAINLCAQHILTFLLGNCDNLYFAFEFKGQMWVQIYQIFKRDVIPICHLSKKLYLNSDKPNTFEFDEA